MQKANGGVQPVRTQIRIFQPNTDVCAGQCATRSTNAVPAVPTLVAKRVKDQETVLILARCFVTLDLAHHVKLQLASKICKSIYFPQIL